MFPRFSDKNLHRNKRLSRPSVGEATQVCFAAQEPLSTPHDETLFILHLKKMLAVELFAELWKLRTRL